MRRKILFSAILLPFVAIVFSCDGLKISEEKKGTLFLKFEAEERTKAVVRDFPDSNLFVLKITKIGGVVVYEGLYGERPDNIQLEAGSYDVEVVSALFSHPSFDTPCYADKKSVIVEGGVTTNLSLLCKQINSGLRLIFSEAFKARFSGYTPVVADTKGEKDYTYSETKFLYVNPGLIEIKARGAAGVATVSVNKRELAANEMLTLSLDAIGTGAPDSKSGIVIDTISVWKNDEVVYGQIRDGSSKERALSIGDVDGRIGDKDLWIFGYISGYLTTASLINTAPFSTETNIAIAETIGISDKSKCVGIALPSGAVREALNLKANPGNLGKRLYIKGDIVESYFGIRGINNVEEFALE